MKSRWWRKCLAAVAAGTVVLVAVILARAALVPSPQANAAAPPQKLQVDAAQAAERLAGAIRIPTVSEQEADRIDYGTFIELHNYLERVFPKVHATLAREVVGRYSLLYTWQGERRDLNPIALIAHLDVVPAEADKAAWTHPPFEGRIADGYVWGRGALDMKHGVMASLEAVEALLQDGFRPPRTVYLAFGHDEEIGGRDGARRIAQLLAMRGVRLAYTLDEGQAIVEGIVPGVAKPVALVGLAEKGYLTLELVVTGKGGHSSMPRADTVIVRLARAIERLDRNPTPASLQPPGSWMFDQLAPEMSFPYKLVFANRWFFEPLVLAQLGKLHGANALIRATATPTVLSAGVKGNVIPASARSLVNFRLLPGETVERAIADVRATIGDPAIDIRVAGEAWNASRVSDSGALGYATIDRAIRRVYPEVAVAPTLTIGATDSRHYAGIADNNFRFIPMRLRPEDLIRIHGVDERIAVSDYLRMVRFYAALMQTAEGDGPRGPV